MSRDTAPAAPAWSIEELLAFEHEHGIRHTEVKEDVLRRAGTTPERYYQLLHRAIDTDEAARLDPVLVRQLRTLRDSRRQTRAGRTQPRKA